MPTSPPPADDLSTRRLRGETYLQAERRHHAELAAARLLETTTPVTSTLSGTRTTQPSSSVTAALTAVPDNPGKREIVAEPAPIAVASVHAGAGKAFGNLGTNPLASFRSETQTDLLKPSPEAPPKPEHTPASVNADTRALLTVAAIGTVAVGALIILALIIWPRASAPAYSESAVATSDTARDPVDAAPLVSARTPAVPVSMGTSGPAQAAPPPSIDPPPSIEEPIAVVTPALPTSVGQLRITSNPNGARVTINGIGWGQTPITVTNLPLGTKTVRLSSDGYASQQRTIELSSGGTSAAVHMALKRLVTGQ